MVDNKSLPSLESGEYYWKDLIGLNVFTTKNKSLGVVDFIFNNGSNDVFAIKNNNIISYIAFIKDNISAKEIEDLSIELAVLENELESKTQRWFELSEISE